MVPMSCLVSSLTLNLRIRRLPNPHLAMSLLHPLTAASPARLGSPRSVPARARPRPKPIAFSSLSPLVAFPYGPALRFQSPSVPARTANRPCTFLVDWSPGATQGTRPLPDRTLHRPAMRRISLSTSSRISLPQLALRAIFRVSFEPFVFLRGRKCSLPIPYWATNCRDYAPLRSVEASVNLR